MRMQPFDIIVYKGNTLTSRIIKWFLKSQYVHVGVLLDEWHIVDIDWRYHLKIRHLDYSVDEYEVYRYGGLTDIHKRQMVKFLRQKLNTQYSMWENIRYLMSQWFGLKLKDNVQRYNCSEMIVDMFHYGGIELFDYDSNKVIMPHALIESEKLTKVL